jgi:hypothetical protein
MGVWTFRKESFYVSNLSSQNFEHPPDPPFLLNTTAQHLFKKNNSAEQIDVTRCLFPHLSQAS